MERKQCCGSGWHSCSRNVCGQQTQPCPTASESKHSSESIPSLTPQSVRLRQGPARGSFTLNCPGSTTTAPSELASPKPSTDLHLRTSLLEPALSLFPGWQGNEAATRDSNIYLVTILDSQDFTIFENSTFCMPACECLEQSKQNPKQENETRVCCQPARTRKGSKGHCSKDLFET